MPTKNAMQSGRGKSSQWMLEYKPQAASTTDKLMGWAGSTDMQKEIRLRFATREEAVGYATRNNIDFEVTEPKLAVSKAKSYAENFTS